MGSGFAAQLPSGERRLFTHAQVVENCTLVQVRRAVDAQKFVARVRCLPQTVCRRLSRECPRPYPPRRASPASQVVCVGFDVDIAVLHVDAHNDLNVPADPAAFGANASVPTCPAAIRPLFHCSVWRSISWIIGLIASKTQNRYDTSRL